MDLSEKVCVITGASSGIGKSLSIKFASKGASVALAARRKSKLTSITDEIKQSGGNAIGIKTDITKSIECKNLIDETLDQYGRIDLLLLGAGVSMWTPFEKISNKSGTAVNVQVMVFGNLGKGCGTGVAFTRNPADGIKEIYFDKTN